MIPIEKNIIVTDVNGNKIGSTFPKRAKGLVKNGRAEYVSDCEIRLLFTQAPTVENYTEERNMSKIIEFNARDYRFDGTCQDNAGERVFITTDLGTKEVWEIGDRNWSRTQIFCEKVLEKNTDYTLRFAVSGGYCDTWDSVSTVWIYHTDGYDTLKDAWEDKMSFPLDNNRFAPIISKRERNGIIRVFEIPFHTDDFENWRITFVAQHAAARFMPAGENSAYDKLPDFSLEELKEAAGNSDLSSADGSRSSGSTKAPADHLNKEYSETEFAEKINDIWDGNCINFENITVHPNISPNEEIMIGKRVDGAVLEFSNITMTSLAMSAIMAKLGDGCIVTFSNVNVTPDGLDGMIDIGKKSDGTIINLSNMSLPKKVLELMREKRGDGCLLDTNNVIAYPV